MKWAEDKFTSADWEKLFKDFPKATAVSFKGCGLKEIESAKGTAEGKCEQLEVRKINNIEGAKGTAGEEVRAAGGEENQ
jgi:hypothetical protein